MNGEFDYESAYRDLETSDDPESDRADIENQTQLDEDQRRPSQEDEEKIDIAPDHASMLNFAITTGRPEMLKLLRTSLKADVLDSDKSTHMVSFLIDALCELAEFAIDCKVVLAHVEDLKHQNKKYEERIHELGVLLFSLAAECDALDPNEETD